MIDWYFVMDRSTYLFMVGYQMFITELQREMRTGNYVVRIIKVPLILLFIFLSLFENEF